MHLWVSCTNVSSEYEHISKAKFTGTVHNENFRKHAKKKRPTLGKSTSASVAVEVGWGSSALTPAQIRSPRASGGGRRGWISAWALVRQWCLMQQLTVPARLNGTLWTTGVHIHCVSFQVFRMNLSSLLLYYSLIRCFRFFFYRFSSTAWIQCFSSLLAYIYISKNISNFKIYSRTLKR